MSNLMSQILSTKLAEKANDSSELSSDGKKANKEISQMGFSLIKDMMNTDDKINTADVNNYLDKADVINDGVDTVVFGLETDDNEIVKVYVACTDADNFEKAMAERLGTEDDIEDVIAELAQEFDIVDVEWPDSNEDESESTEDESETQNAKDLESKEAEPELNFDKPVVAKEQKGENMLTPVERFKMLIENELMQEKKKEPRKWPASIESFAKTLTTPAQQDILYLIWQFGLPDEVISGNRSVDIFKRNLVNVSHEYLKNQTLKIWVNRLTKEFEEHKKKEEKNSKKHESEREVVKEIIKESGMPKNDGDDEDPIIDWDDPKLLKAIKFRETLPRGIPRLIFDVLLGLGIPETRLTDVNKTKVRESIRILSTKVRRNQQLRINMNLIAQTLNIDADDQTEIASKSKTIKLADKPIKSTKPIKPRSTTKPRSTVKSGKTVKEELLDEEAIIQDKYTVAALGVLAALGIPKEYLEFRLPNVKSSFKDKKRQFSSISMVITRLTDLTAFINANQIQGANSAQVTEDTNMHPYAELVVSFATMLGLPQINLTRFPGPLNLALVKRKSQLRSTVITQVKRIVTILQKSLGIGQEPNLGLTKTPTQFESLLARTNRILLEKKEAEKKEAEKKEAEKKETEKDDVAKILDKGKDIKATKATESAAYTAAKNLGSWNFSALGSNAGLTMRARTVKIQFEDIVSERIVKALKNGTGTSAKSVQKQEITFKAQGFGQYVINGLEDYENGIKLDKHDVENLVAAMTKDVKD